MKKREKDQISALFLLAAAPAICPGSFRLSLGEVKKPGPGLFPLILLFCVIGSFSLNNNTEDVLLMIIFGILGYFIKKFDYEGAPLILILVLSPVMENALRQTLLISQGSFLIFITRRSLLRFCL
jgi:TctA family transporter